MGPEPRVAGWRGSVLDEQEKQDMWPGRNVVPISKWRGQSGDWLDATRWSGGVPDDSAAGAQITASGTYRVIVAASEDVTAQDVTFDAAGATLAISGTLTLTGTLNLQHGKLNITGTLSGATVVLGAGGMVSAGSDASTHVLDGTTWIGGLAFFGYHAYTIRHGLAVFGADGSSPGVISDSLASSTTLNFADSTTLDNLSLYGNYYLGLIKPSTMLTFGSQFSTDTVRFSIDPAFGKLVGTIVNYGSIKSLYVYTASNFTNEGVVETSNYSGSMVNGASGVLKLDDDPEGEAAHFDANFVNQGQIVAEAPPTDARQGVIHADATFANTASGLVDLQGFVLDVGGNLNNAGVINAGAGSSVVIVGSFLNTGTVRITDGASIFLEAGVANSGTLTITNSKFVIGGRYNASFVNRYTGMGDTFGIATTINNAGHVLAFSSDTLKGVLDGGVITGGLIRDLDDESFFAADGTLDGVTVQGELSIRDGGSLTIEHGLTVTAATGGGPGTISVLSGGLFLDGLQTLDNATISLAGGPAANGMTIEGTLTLGRHLTMLTTTLFGTAVYLSGGSSLINDGAISGPISLAQGTFTNNGVVEVTSGSYSNIKVDTFTNLSRFTLTAGTYVVRAGATLLFVASGTIRDPAAIVTDAATIVLDGSGSTLDALEQTLTTVTANGELDILGMRGFAGTPALTDKGVITLEGGSFGGQSLSISATGSFSGNGVIADATLVNSGIVTATGDGLSVTGKVSGSGTFTAGTGATLEFQSSVAATDTINLAGASATLALDAPSTVHAKIAGFSTGDTIALDGTTATSLLFVASSDKLFVRNESDIVAALQLQGSYTAASFHLTQSGADAMITTT